MSFSSYFRKLSGPKTQSAPVQCGPKFHGHDCENTSEKLMKVISPKAYQWSLTGAQWITEAQTYYLVSKTGKFLLLQIAYSNLSWPAQVTCQLTARYFDPASGKPGRSWVHNLAASKMKLGPDKRSVQIKSMNIQHLDEETHQFEIRLSFQEGDQVELDLAFIPLLEPFSVMDGNWYFGVNRRDGFINMKFIPFGKVSGFLSLDGIKESFDGFGMNLHQFQGIKPYLTASKWNFVYFQEEETEDNEAANENLISAFMIQIKTPAAYDGVMYNIGSIFAGGKLIGVSVGNGLEEFGRELDPESGYLIPRVTKYIWTGTTFSNEPFKVLCEAEHKNLADKVNVLDHLPFFLRKAIEAFVSRPYAYYWMDRTELEIRIGDQESRVKGWVLQELALINAEN